MSDYKFIPYEFPKSTDGQYTILQLDHQILQSRREQLGLSQQQVADIAHIQLRQYQRLESAQQYLSGCSMRIGLSVCAALYMDPYELVGLNIHQPDISAMRPQYTHDVDLPPELLNFKPPKKRVGRKPTKKETLRVYLDCKRKLVILPPNVLEALQNPTYLQTLYNEDNNHIALRVANKSDEKVIPMPPTMSLGEHLAIGIPSFSRTLQLEAKQAKMLIADVQLVRDTTGRLGIIVDPSVAAPAESLTVPIISV